MCDMSFQFDRCRCRCWDIKKTKTVDPERCSKEIINHMGQNEHDEWIGSEKWSYNYPLVKCDMFSGYHLDTWATYIIPKIHEAKQYKKDRCE